MPSLHDPATHAALRARVAALRPDATPRWGRMRVDQMLWHVNGGLALALGELTGAPTRTPLPGPVMRFLVLNAPWPKGAPTMPEMRATAEHDFATERARCLALIDRVVATPIDGRWPTHPRLGPMRGVHWSRLEAKHLAHHLDQFGA